MIDLVRPVQERTDELKTVFSKLHAQHKAMVERNTDLAVMIEAMKKERIIDIKNELLAELEAKYHFLLNDQDKRCNGMLDNFRAIDTRMDTLTASLRTYSDHIKACDSKVELFYTTVHNTIKQESRECLKQLDDQKRVLHAFRGEIGDYYKNTDFINTRLDAFENNQTTYNDDLYNAVERLSKAELGLDYCLDHVAMLEKSETFTFCEKRLKLV